MDFIEELKWRGMLQDITPGVGDYLSKPALGYVGFDPTADSLHIGSLLPITLLSIFQKYGHTPIILIGGATAMIGDPSGKSKERNLLSVDVIRENVVKIKEQLSKFLSFEGKNAAVIVNNYDWFKGFSFLDFLREYGKHTTVNYMMAKDSVKQRLQTGISFTEFSYQLMQGYDFLHLYKYNACALQLGGSDQWGNITTGIDIIRKQCSEEAHGITAPLVTKSDGTKFGKTEDGNIWLNRAYTSPYRFYQFWINTSDMDAEKYIRLFSLATIEDIQTAIDTHKQAPEKRYLQKLLAKELTIRVHSQEDYQQAVVFSELFFGGDTLKNIENFKFDVFSELAKSEDHIYILSRSDIQDTMPIVDFLAKYTPNLVSSKSDAIRNIKANGIAVNTQKITLDYVISLDVLIADKYLLLQRGKKKYSLIGFSEYTQ